MDRNIVAKLVYGLFGAVVEDNGLTGSEGLGCLLCCLEKILERFSPLRSCGKMIGKHFIMLSQPVRVQRLDHTPNQAVEFLPPLCQERVVGYVLRQGVLKQVD